MRTTYAPQERKQKHTPAPAAAQPQMAGSQSLAVLMQGHRPTSQMLGRRVDLPAAIQAKMEASFGADLSGVRLYESQTVADAGANAVAVGNQISFAPGKLDFISHGGQALLGHELSHVVSQARGEVTGSGFLNDHALEARADREGQLAAAGESVFSGAAAPISAVSAASAAGPMQASKADKKKPVTDMTPRNVLHTSVLSDLVVQNNNNVYRAGNSERRSAAETKGSSRFWDKVATLNSPDVMRAGNSERRSAAETKGSSRFWDKVATLNSPDVMRAGNSERRSAAETKGSSRFWDKVATLNSPDVMRAGNSERRSAAETKGSSRFWDKVATLNSPDVMRAGNSERRSAAETKGSSKFWDKVATLNSPDVIRAGTSERKSADQTKASSSFLEKVAAIERPEDKNKQFSYLAQKQLDEKKKQKQPGWFSRTLDRHERKRNEAIDQINNNQEAYNKMNKVQKWWFGATHHGAWEGRAKKDRTKTEDRNKRKEALKSVNFELDTSENSVDAHVFPTPSQPAATQQGPDYASPLETFRTTNTDGTVLTGNAPAIPDSSAARMSTEDVLSHPAFGISTGLSSGIMGSLTNDQGGATGWLKGGLGDVAEGHLKGASGAIDTVTGGISLGLDAKSAHESRMRGDTGGTWANSISAIGDLSTIAGGLSNIADVAGASVPDALAPGLGIVTGGAQMISAGKRLYDNGRSDDKLDKMNITGDDAEKKRIAEITRQTHDSNNIRKTEAKYDMASGALTAAGGIAELSGAGAAAGVALAGAGAAVNTVKEIHVNKMSKDQRTNEVNRAFHLDREIERLKLQHPKLNLTDKEAKHMVLDKMGFKTGKRKEAYQHLTQNRAKYMAEDSANKDVFADAVGLKKVNGAYDVNAMAERIGGKEVGEEAMAKTRAKAIEKQIPDFVRKQEKKAARARAGIKPWQFWKRTPTTP